MTRCDVVKLSVKVPSDIFSAIEKLRKKKLELSRSAIVRDLLREKLEELGLIKK